MLANRSVHALLCLLLRKNVHSLKQMTIEGRSNVESQYHRKTVMLIILRKLGILLYYLAVISLAVSLG